MHISRLFVKNFRNFRHLDVAIGNGVTCFIGENNSGKTNLLHAIRLLLDGSFSTQRRRLTVDDFAMGLNPAQPEHALISVEFSDFRARVNEEALLMSAVLQNGRARLTYPAGRYISTHGDRERLTLAQTPEALASFAREAVASILVLGDDVEAALALFDRPSARSSNT